MNIKKYIKKYSIILIILIGLQGLIKIFVISQLSMILLNLGIEFNKANYLTNTILINIPYLINIIIATLIFIDLFKLKIKGIPVVLLTVFSNLVGVIFFLFLINNKIEHNDK